MEAEKKMSFMDHLEELRWRLVKSAIAILIFAIVIWVFQEWVMDNLFLSMSKSDFFTFQKLCQIFNVCTEDIHLKMQSTALSGQFSYALMMSILGGVVLAFPFVFYQLWAFVKPGLKDVEKSLANGIVLYVSLLFFVGICFGYFIGGLEKAESQIINCPRVAIAPATFECRLTQIVQLEGQSNHAVFGEVVGVHMNEAFIEDGKFDVTKFIPLSRLGYRDYSMVDKTFTLARPDD